MMNYGGIVFILCVLFFPAIAALIKRAICGVAYQPIHHPVADATKRKDSL